MRTLVTGVSGFVGQALCREMMRRGLPVLGAIRTEGAAPVPGLPCIRVGEIGPSTAWADALAGVDSVVHLAARVHVMHETAADPLALFRDVNVEGTRTLAAASARQGVKRFVFVSSIKVNGEETTREPFRESCEPNPDDPYAVSKWEAETVLRHVEAETGMDVVVLRIPLVYGPGVRGNFRSLLQSVHSGRILPLGSIQNKRSLLGLGNLVDLLIQCREHPSARGQTFLVSDGEDVSTPELVRGIARALDCRSRLVRIPLPLLRVLACLLRRGGAFRKIAGSLQVDSSFVRRTLDWVPPRSMTDELDATASWFRSTQVHTPTTV